VSPGVDWLEDPLSIKLADLERRLR
jgi:hypothetical protein